MSKSSLLKNARNYAEYLRKKERGPVKAFFHITKNENVPAIEQQGLLTNHPNANVNSAAHPFRKHGTDAGGVWVTTKPTAFPVYGTTIGGKNGNSAARADALSTIKIEVPLPELAKMKAVQDPYGRNILRKGNDPRAVQKFPTWAGIDVPTTVLLNDVKPQWLKNIGYVEERNPGFGVNDPKGQLLDFGLEMLPKEEYGNLRNLSKADRHAFSLLTGHDASRAPKVDLEKSPARFVKEYLEKNRPIRDRLPQLPDGLTHGIWHTQFPSERFDELIKQGKRLELLPPTAEYWTYEFKPYTKPGEAPRQIIFQPGAYSRGMGSLDRPTKETLQNRRFNWNKYLEGLSESQSPYDAASDAAPEYVLDWDNIVYQIDKGYVPKIIEPADNSQFNMNIGHISAGTPRGHVKDVVTGEYLVNPNEQGAIDQFQQLGSDDIESLKVYNAYDDIVKDKDHPTWQELVRVIMRINAGTSTPHW